MATSLANQSITQLTRHIRNVSQSTELVFITTHARIRMRERRVLDAEVYDCLQRGSIRLTPEPDAKTGHLICRMECYGASRNITVCAALDDSNPGVVVVTVITRT